MGKRQLKIIQNKHYSPLIYHLAIREAATSTELSELTGKFQPVAWRQLNELTRQGFVKNLTKLPNQRGKFAINFDKIIDEYYNYTKTKIDERYNELLSHLKQRELKLRKNKGIVEGQPELTSLVDYYRMWGLKLFDINKFQKVRKFFKAFFIKNFQRLIDLKKTDMTPEECFEFLNLMISKRASVAYNIIMKSVKIRYTKEGLEKARCSKMGELNCLGEILYDIQWIYFPKVEYFLTDEELNNIDGKKAFCNFYDFLQNVDE